MINCPTTAAVVDLADTANQAALIRFWIAEADPATGEVIGTPELQFTGMIDTLSLSLARNSRSVTIEYAAATERLFMIKEGNVLSARFHKDLWPGESGMNHCTNSITPVPWNAPMPPRNFVSNNTGSSLFTFKG